MDTIYLHAQQIEKKRNAWKIKLKKPTNVYTSVIALAQSKTCHVALVF